MNRISEFQSYLRVPLMHIVVSAECKILSNCLQAELENLFDLLPDDEFFKSLPTYTKLEQYFRVSASVDLCSFHYYTLNYT